MSIMIKYAYGVLIIFFLACTLHKGSYTKYNSTPRYSMLTLDECSVNSNLSKNLGEILRDKASKKSTVNFLRLSGSDWLPSDASESTYIPILYTRLKHDATGIETDENLINYIEYNPNCQLYAFTATNKAGASIMLSISLENSMFVPSNTEPCNKDFTILTNPRDEIEALINNVTGSCSFAFFVDGMYDLIWFYSGSKYYALQVHTGQKFMPDDIVGNVYSNNFIRKLAKSSSKQEVDSKRD